MNRIVWTDRVLAIALAIVEHNKRPNIATPWGRCVSAFREITGFALSANAFQKKVRKTDAKSFFNKYPGDARYGMKIVKAFYNAVQEEQDSKPGVDEVFENAGTTVDKCEGCIDTFEVTGVDAYGDRNCIYDKKIPKPEYKPEDVAFSNRYAIKPHFIFEPKWEDGFCAKDCQHLVGKNELPSSCAEWVWYLCDHFNEHLVRAQALERAHPCVECRRAITRYLWPSSPGSSVDGNATGKEPDDKS